MKIYLDSDFRCHLADDGTMTAIETDTFVVFLEILVNIIIAEKSSV